MPISVFGITLGNSSNTFETSSFVQKPSLRNSFIEIDIEEDIDIKNQYKIKNIPIFLDDKEAVSKAYVDDEFRDPSIMKKTQVILTSITKILIMVDLLKLLLLRL